MYAVHVKCLQKSLELVFEAYSASQEVAVDIHINIPCLGPRWIAVLCTDEPKLSGKSI